MVIVQSIDELITRQGKVDAAFRAEADRVSTTHPDWPKDPRPYRFVRSLNTDCPVKGCGAPVFLVRDREVGKEIPICRACLNATRKLSLIHRDPIVDCCLVCRVDTDSFGIVIAANHRMEVPFEDFPNRKSTAPEGAMVHGLKTRIANGLIEVDDDDDWVYLHHVVHDRFDVDGVEQHCAGCCRRHRGCPKFPLVTSDGKSNGGCPIWVGPLR